MPLTDLLSFADQTALLSDMNDYFISNNIYNTGDFVQKNLKTPVFTSPGRTMEEILFETPQIFVPSPTHFAILQEVANKQGCHIGHVVHQLQPDHSESSVRSSVRILLSKRYLDGGKSSSEVSLRLTSKGRVLLQSPQAS